MDQNPATYPQGLGSCAQQDLDFGASPNLFTDAGGRKLVGAGQKSGVYHVFDAGTMAPVWKTTVGPPSSVGGIVGSTAIDESGVYGPITIGGYLWSLDRTGANRWATPVADGVHWGNPVAVGNNIVYTVDLKGFLDAYDGRLGTPLLHRPIAAGSGTGNNPVASWGGVSIARNTVYAAVGGGVEAPAFNEINPSPIDSTTSINPLLEPMTSTRYEVGFKGEVGVGTNLGRVGYGVAGYQIDVSNDIIPFNGGAWFFTAGETRRRGIELGADWRPSTPLRVRTSMAFTNKEYLTYSNNLGTSAD
jgi:hypothetical protein